MAIADEVAGMARNEHGFTLIELLVVLIIMAILVAVAFGFSQGARERAADATARANLRTAMPAMEAYRADSGTYSGMTLAALQSQYSPGIEGIVVVSANDVGYCVSATSGGSTWFKGGPDGSITKTACS
jgi:prepilin-type N-terminal cleavage/methylation domain-containing protein